MFQTKVSVFEKAIIQDHPIFLSVEALKLRQGQRHFFIILFTQSMKIVVKSFLFLFISYDTHDNTHR